MKAVLMQFKKFPFQHPDIAVTNSGSCNVVKSENKIHGGN